MRKPAPFTHDDYRDILRCGLSAGFRFAGFAERGSGGKLCLLRHDCDNDLVAAAAMADIEASEGVRSTYFLMLRSALYNLLAPDNLCLARRIIDRGHWIGLHFDASVMAENHERSIVREVDRQREILEHELGCAVEVTSFHQPDDRILNPQFRLNCVNTYDHRDMADIHYTSDSNLLFRGGEPRALFAGGPWKIQVLVHPEWWTEELMPLEQKWAAMLRNSIGLMQKSLLAREKTYTKPHRVIIG